MPHSIPLEGKVFCFDTILGSMMAIGDNRGLCYLGFVPKDNIQKEIEKQKKRMKNLHITFGSVDSILSVKSELEAYFQGTLREFTTPLYFLGTDFQRETWKALMNIPYGKTQSYAAQAGGIRRPKAYRAVANANGANTLAIIVPCHRVVQSNGALGGYSGGVNRKEWLLCHEKNNV